MAPVDRDPVPPTKAAKPKKRRWWHRRARSGYPRLLPVGTVPGLLVALVVAAAGGWYVYQQPRSYSAETQLLLAPAGQGDAGATSSYWETLSSGQLPATAAAVVDDKRYVDEATEGLDKATRGAVQTSVTVLPSTAVIDVRVVAPTADVAESVANAIATRSTGDVNSMLTPYQLSPIGSATGSATRTSLDYVQWGTLVAVAALIAGLLVQQLLSWAARARARARTARAAEAAPPA